MINRIPLEPAALQICINSAIPPLIFQLPPTEGRMKLEELQSSYVHKCPAHISWTNFDCGEWGMIKVYVVKPEGCPQNPKTIFYIHGAGWVFGSFHTHEKLVRELAAKTNSILVFPEYSLSPEARYPTALEQCYRVLCSLSYFKNEVGLDLNLSHLTIAGDSVGGNMAAAMCLMSDCRKGPRIHKLLLYYPVTNACFCTNSYRQFAVNYYLYRAGMIWFWNQYTCSDRDRAQITASPLRADLEQLRCFPDTMIINGETDVLRDEGEAFAAKLMMAGVNVTAVRIKGIIHDFVMLNALDQTNACRTAMDISAEWVNRCR